MKIVSAGAGGVMTEWQLFVAAAILLWERQDLAGRNRAGEDACWPTGWKPAHFTV